MSLASEFKEFAMKGNVVDLAVGVIIGAAFGKIVSSLVGDLFMPVLGKIIGDVNFSDLAISLGTDPAGKAVLIKYGTFLQTLLDFLIIALVLFMCIKAINKLKKPAPVVRGRGARRPRNPSCCWRKSATCSPSALEPQMIHSNRVSPRSAWRSLPAVSAWADDTHRRRRRAF